MNKLMTKKLSLIFAIVIVLMTVLAPSTAFAAGDKGEAGKVFGVKVQDDGSVVLDGANESKEASAETIIEKLRWGVGFVGAVSLICMIAILIIGYVKLGMAGDNPNKRKEIQSGIMWKFIAAAGIGSASALIAIFFRFFY